MAFTYNKDLSTPRDKVRFLIQDRDIDKQFFDDEELDALLKINKSYIRTAMMCCNSLAALFAAEPDSEKAGTWGVNNSTVSERYLRLAESLRTQLLRTLSCHATGLYVSDVATNDENTDIIKAAFSRNMMNNWGMRYDKERFE